VRRLALLPVAAPAALWAGLLVLLLLPCAARAEVIAGDNFESYLIGAQLEDGPNGSAGTGLNGGSGFTGPYNVIDNNLKSNVTVAAQSLNYSSGAVSVSGGLQSSRIADAANGTANGLFTRPFAAQNDTVYFSFLYRTNNPSATSEDFVQIGFSDVATGEPKTSVATGSNATGNPPPAEFFVRVPAAAANSTGSGIPLQEDTDYLVVGKFSKASGSSAFNRVDLFLNPTTMTEPGTATVFREAPAGSGPPTISNFIVRTARLDAGDQYFIDNLTIGTTYADVVPEPGSAGALSIAALACLRRRRRHPLRR
jgi:hypothetical protein